MRAVALAEAMAVKAGVQLIIEQDHKACRLDMDPVLIEQVLQKQLGDFQVIGF